MNALKISLVALSLVSGAAFADSHAAGAHGKPIPTKTPMTSSKSPSLAQVVALGHADVEAPALPAVDAIAGHVEAPAAVDAHAEPAADAHAAEAHGGHAAADAHEAKDAPAFLPSTTALPAALTGDKPADATPGVPFGAIAFFIAMGGGTFALWWNKKKKTAVAGGPLMTVRESTSIGPRRQLMVVDVAGRRVLLSSSEAGVSMLMDCGPVPAAASSTADEAERFFGDALAKAVRAEPIGGLQLVNAAGADVPTMPLVAPLPMAAPMRKNEAEATELMRRLGR